MTIGCWLLVSGFLESPAEEVTSGWVLSVLGMGDYCFCLLWPQHLLLKRLPPGLYSSVLFADLLCPPTSIHLLPPFSPCWLISTVGSHHASVLSSHGLWWQSAPLPFSCSPWAGIRELLSWGLCIQKSRLHLKVFSASTPHLSHHYLQAGLQTQPASPR